MYSAHSLLIAKGLWKKSMEIENVDFFFFFLKNISSCGKYCIFTFQFQRVLFPSWQLRTVSLWIEVVPDSLLPRIQPIQIALCSLWDESTCTSRYITHDVADFSFISDPYIPFFFWELAYFIGTLPYATRDRVLGAFSNLNMQFGTWNISENIPEIFGA